MRLLPVLLLVTGCASATPPPSSPAADAMRVCVDQAERDAALVDHWMAGCGKRKQPEDPACYREHEAMFDTLEVHRNGCTWIERHTLAVDDPGHEALPIP